MCGLFAHVRPMAISCSRMAKIELKIRCRSVHDHRHPNGITFRWIDIDKNIFVSTSLILSLPVSFVRPIKTVDRYQRQRPAFTYIKKLIGWDVCARANFYFWTSTSSTQQQIDDWFFMNSDRQVLNRPKNSRKYFPWFVRLWRCESFDPKLHK